MSYKWRNVNSISVVIASFRSKDTIERCLNSLTNQTEEPLEVIVVDSGDDGAASLIRQKFPQVRLLTSLNRKYPGDARNLGVPCTTGEIVAFLDADCVAPRDWVQQIRLAHQGPEHLIGGAFDNGNPINAVSWAAYFCELSQWMPAGEPRYMAEVPSGNLSFKRWVFDRFGPFLENTYCSDSVFNWRAQAAGFPPKFVPSIRVSHYNRTNWKSFLPKQVMHGQALATVRVKERKLKVWQTAGLMVGCPALPFLLFMRILVRIAPHRIWLLRLLAAAPAVFLGLVAWSCGECAGYWKSLRKLLPASRPGESTEAIP